MPQTPSVHPAYGHAAVGDVPFKEHTMVLKCSACGKVHQHAVGKVIVDPGYTAELRHLKPIDALRGLTKVHWEKWVSFSGYFVCPKCGSGGPWEFTADSKQHMQLLVGRYAMGDEEALFLGKHIMFDGTSPRTCFEGAAHLQRLIDADPANAYLWNRLGNLFRGADEPERARPAFEKALELEPRCIETLHSLGDYWMSPFRKCLPF